MPQIVEVVRLRVSPEHVERFVAERPAVDAAVQSLGGFAGSELIHVEAEEWMLMVYWNTRADVEAAQKVTRDIQIISDWIALGTFISFTTAEIHHSSR